MTYTIEQLKELCENASPGPWDSGLHEIHEYCGQNVSTFEVAAQHDMCWIAKVQEHRSCSATSTGDVNGKFIAVARTALPELIKELKVRNAEIERLRADNNAAHAWFERHFGEAFRGRDLAVKVTMADGEMARRDQERRDRYGIV